MVRQGYRDGMEKYDFSFISVFRIASLLIVPIIAYGLGLLPSLFSLYYILSYLNFSNPLHLILFSFVLVIIFFLFMIFETIVPGLFIKIFRIKCGEGTFNLSIKDKSFYLLALHYVLYRPPLKLIEQFKLLPLRVLFLKLAGLKIGKTSIIPGTELFYDPFVIEIGENTLFGGHVEITGHVIDKIVTMKKVRIGDNCLIGAESFIMPGAIIEDNVTVGIRTLVTKDQVLKKGKTYVGMPAREIKGK